MAEPTFCTAASIAANGACLSGKSLTKIEQTCIKIMYMAYQLRFIGGTDYTSSLSTTLISAAACKSQAFTPDDFRVWEIEIESLAALLVAFETGHLSLMPADNNAAAAVYKCLKNASMAQLKAAELQLRCELGRAKSYPQ